MQIQITEGMTPDQFVTALNTNFAETNNSYTTITIEMDGETLLLAINDNYSRSEILFGKSGTNYINTINNNFLSDYNIVLTPPSGLSASWINDFVRINWSNNSENTEVEVWESKNGGIYSKSYTTTSNDLITCDHYAWQNCNLNIKLKAKRGILTSELSDEVINMFNPLVIKTNQSTLSQISIKTIEVTSGGVINFDWGDGTDTDFTAGVTSNFTKDYIVENDCYFITISGDLDKFRTLEWMSQTCLFGDLNKWTYPLSLRYLHFYGNTNIGGDISGWILPDDMGLFHIGGCDFEGDLTNWVLADTLYDFRLLGNNFTGDISEWTFPMDNGASSFYFEISDNGFTGDISEWLFPSNMGYLAIDRNYLTGNLSNWRFPSNLALIVLTGEVGETNSFTGDISEWTFPTNESPTMANGITCRNIPFTGDLSGIEILEGTQDITINFINNNLTKLPRGNFKWIKIYNFGTNNCAVQEIDDILAYIDAYFVGGVVPLTNCVYTLNGTGMGIPSAAGLISKTSIEGKYTAAGKTATITINS